MSTVRPRPCHCRARRRRPVWDTSVSLARRARACAPRVRGIDKTRADDLDTTRTEELLLAGARIITPPRGREEDAPLCVFGKGTRFESRNFDERERERLRLLRRIIWREIYYRDSLAGCRVFCHVSESNYNLTCEISLFLLFVR